MVIYTDGSYRPLDRECTFGFIIVNDENITYKFKESEKITRNKKIKKYSATYAELKAIMYAVKHAKENNEYAIIYSDLNSVNQIILKNRRYNINFINEFKKYMRENKDLYEIKFVKGHSTNKYNNFVDDMCRSSMYKIEKIVGRKKYFYNISNKKLIKGEC